jgi:hypothetical protein
MATNFDETINETKRILEKMQTYEKTIFKFDHAENDFKPGKITPKEDGWYLTIRCGFPGIYTVLNEWKDGRWQMECADGSYTIAYSREKFDISKILE